MYLYSTGIIHTYSQTTGLPTNICLEVNEDLHKMLRWKPCSSGREGNHVINEKQMKKKKKSGFN